MQTVQGVQCDAMQVISSWCNCADVGAVQAPHCHENSWISGTVTCVLEGHTHLLLASWGLSPAQPPYLSMAAEGERTSFSANKIQIAPAPGTLLLWLSHLLHGHSGNARNGRLSLSMNLLPQRLIGSSYGLEVSPLVINA